MAAATKTEDGQAFPAAAYAYVPDASTPSTWKLRLWDAPDAGGPNAKNVGAAVAALGPGFRGQKVSIPAKDRAAVKKKVLAAWKSLNPDAKPADVPAALKEAYTDQSLEARVSLVRQAYCDQMTDAAAGVTPDTMASMPYVCEVRDASIIVQQGEDYYEVPYTIGPDDDAVTFGTPVEVEPTYVPVGSAPGAEPMAESLAPLGDARYRLIESASGPRGSRWTVRVIAPGYSRNISAALRLPRYYPADVLQESLPRFERVRVFLHESGPHLGPGASRRAQDYVGWLTQPRWDAGVVCDFVCVDGALRGKLLESADAGRLDVLGFSIDGDGAEQVGTAENKRAAVVSRIGQIDSVDVVTDPAAGGEFVRLIAAADAPHGGTIMDLQKLLESIKAVRPDLVAAEPAGGWTLELLEAKLREALKPTATDPEAVKLREALAVQQSEVAAMRADLLARDRRHAIGVALDASAVGRIPSARIAVEKRMALVVEADPTKWQAALTEAVADQVAAAGEAGKVAGFGGALARVTEDESERHQAAMDGMLFNADRELNGKKVPRFRSIRESYMVISGSRDWRYNPAQLLREAIMYQPMTVDFGHTNPLRESVVTSTWSKVLGDSITRRMIAEYAQDDMQVWRQIVSEIGNITDFRTNRRTRMGGYGDLGVVNQGAPYPALTSPTDEEATYAISKKGGVDDLTLETIANDDVGAVRKIPISMGRAAARTLYKAVFGVIRDNPVIYDGLTLFESGTHLNMTAAALSDATVKAGVAAMRSQKAFGITDETLGSVNAPRFLLVPNGLEDLAFRLTASMTWLGQSATGTETATSPNMLQARYGIKVIVVDSWTDPNDCALVTDPTRVPTIEVGFWNGQEDPELFVQDQPLVGSVFTADKVTYKVRHVWGLTPLEYRGFYGFSR
jgi:hypothetical protein